MQGELSSAIGSKRYFGRDLTNFEGGLGNHAAMDEEKVSYSNLEPHKRERQRQPASRPNSSKYATLIQNNSRPANAEYPRVQEGLGYRGDHSKDRIANTKTFHYGHNYYVNPREENYYGKIENEIPPSLGYQAKEHNTQKTLEKEILNNRGKSLKSTTHSPGMLIEEETDFSINKQLTFANSSFGEASRLPLGYIWNHLIAKKVRDYHPEQQCLHLSLFGKTDRHQ